MRRPPQFTGLGPGRGSNPSITAGVAGGEQSWTSPLVPIQPCMALSASCPGLALPVAATTGGGHLHCLWSWGATDCWLGLAPVLPCTEPESALCCLPCLLVWVTFFEAPG